jgi:signal transduction histidine kinase
MAVQNLLEEPKDIKELASSINRSGGEMLRLIEDFLDVERIAVGKLTLHYEQHDVSEIIKQAVEGTTRSRRFQGNNLRGKASRRVWLRCMRPKPRHAGVVKSD